jgi:hypothetical protein
VPCVHLIEAWWPGAGPGVNDAAALRAAAHVAAHPGDAVVTIGPRAAVERAARLGLASDAAVCPILGRPRWSRRTTLRRVRDLAAVRPGLLGSASRVVVWTPGAFAAASLLDLDLVDRTIPEPDLESSGIPSLPALPPLDLRLDASPEVAPEAPIVVLLSDPPESQGVLAAAYALSLTANAGHIPGAILVVPRVAVDRARAGDFLVSISSSIRLHAVDEPAAVWLPAADLVLAPPARDEAHPAVVAARAFWIRRALAMGRRVIGTTGDPEVHNVPNEPGGLWSRTELGRAIADVFSETPV